MSYVRRRAGGREVGGGRDSSVAHNKHLQNEIEFPYFEVLHKYFMCSSFCPVHSYIHVTHATNSSEKNCRLLAWIVGRSSRRANTFFIEYARAKANKRRKHALAAPDNRREWLNLLRSGRKTRMSLLLLGATPIKQFRLQKVQFGKFYGILTEV